MATDLKLRNYLLTTVVGILLSIGGCYGKTLSADINSLKSENSQRKIENAVIKQNLDDFRKSFEDFKLDVQRDISRHHQ